MSSRRIGDAAPAVISKQPKPTTKSQPTAPSPSAPSGWAAKPTAPPRNATQQRPTLAPSSPDVQSDAPVFSARALMAAQPPPSASGPTMSRLLKRGVQGEDVRQLQQKLAALGIHAPQSGVYDAQTERAVKTFQRSAPGLAVDGDAGRKTLTALGFTWGRATPTHAPEQRTRDASTVRGTSNARDASTVRNPSNVREATTLRETVRDATTVRETVRPQVLEVDSVRNGSLLSGPSFNDLRAQAIDLPGPSIELPAVLESPRVSAARMGTAAERLTLATKLVEKRGAATSQADVDAVVSAVAELPLSDLRDLERAGMSVVACRDSVVDAVPSLAGVQPRGHAPGRGWQDVPGAYIPGEKAVVIATRGTTDGAREVPPFNVKHGSASLVAHEVAHALDAARRYPSKEEGAFSTAYEADVAAGQLLPYYTQPGEAGRSEAYAESFALFISGDTRGDGARRFPNLMQFWKNEYAGARS